MKEKHKKWLQYPNNDLYQSRKYVYSKKCLKQRRQPPYPSLQQSRLYFRAEKVTWLRLLFAIEYAYPADKVTKRSFYRSP